MDFGGFRKNVVNVVEKREPLLHVAFKERNDLQSNSKPVPVPRSEQAKRITECFSEHYKNRERRYVMYYVVSQTWLKKWMIYVDWEEYTKHKEKHMFSDIMGSYPGPVDNKDIISNFSIFETWISETKGNLSMSCNGRYTCKTDLSYHSAISTLQIHRQMEQGVFHLVPKSVWSLFLLWYGGKYCGFAPTLPRYSCVAKNPHTDDLNPVSIFNPFPVMIPVYYGFSHSTALRIPVFVNFGDVKRYIIMLFGFDEKKTWTLKYQPSVEDIRDVRTLDDKMSLFDYGVEKLIGGHFNLWANRSTVSSESVIGYDVMQDTYQENTREDKQSVDPSSIIASSSLSMVKLKDMKKFVGETRSVIFGDKYLATGKKIIDIETGHVVREIVGTISSAGVLKRMDCENEGREILLWCVSLQGKWSIRGIDGDGLVLHERHERCLGLPFPVSSLFGICELPEEVVEFKQSQYPFILAEGKEYIMVLSYSRECELFRLRKVDVLSKFMQEDNFFQRSFDYTDYSEWWRCERERKDSMQELGHVGIIGGETNEEEGTKVEKPWNYIFIFSSIKTTPIRLVDSETRKEVMRFDKHYADVATATTYLNSKKEEILVTGGNQTLHIYNVKLGTLLSRYSVKGEISHIISSEGALFLFEKKRYPLFGGRMNIFSVDEASRCVLMASKDVDCGTSSMEFFLPSSEVGNSIAEASKYRSGSLKSFNIGCRFFDHINESDNKWNNSIAVLRLLVQGRCVTLKTIRPPQSDKAVIGSSIFFKPNILVLGIGGRIIFLDVWQEVVVDEFCPVSSVGKLLMNGKQASSCYKISLLKYSKDCFFCTLNHVSSLLRYVGFLCGFRISQSPKVGFNTQGMRAMCFLEIPFEGYLHSIRRIGKNSLLAQVHERPVLLVDIRKKAVIKEFDVGGQNSPGQYLEVSLKHQNHFYVVSGEIITMVDCVNDKNKRVFQGHNCHVSAMVVCQNKSNDELLIVSPSVSSGIKGIVFVYNTTKSFMSVLYCVGGDFVRHFRYLPQYGTVVSFFDNAIGMLSLKKPSIESLYYCEMSELDDFTIDSTVVNEESDYVVVAIPRGYHIKLHLLDVTKSKEISSSFSDKEDPTSDFKVFEMGGGNKECDILRKQCRNQEELIASLEKQYQSVKTEKEKVVEREKKERRLYGYRFNDYTILEVIGGKYHGMDGVNSNVCKVKLENENSLFAIKIVLNYLQGLYGETNNSTVSSMEHILTEAMYSLPFHRNICRIHHCFIDLLTEKNLEDLKWLEYYRAQLQSGNLRRRTAFFVMPLYDCSLKDIIRNGVVLEQMKVGFRRYHFQDEKVFFSFVSDMLNAVNIIQDYGLVHRDLKKENVFYDKKEDCFVLGDFGAAVFSQYLQVEKGNVKSIKGGSPDCVPPEVYDAARLAARESKKKVRRKQKREKREVEYVELDKWDLFSLGLVCYELFSDNTPLGAHNDRRRDELYRELNEEECKSKKIRETINKMLRCKYEERISVDDLLKITKLELGFEKVKGEVEETEGELDE